MNAQKAFIIGTLWVTIPCLILIIGIPIFYSILADLRSWTLWGLVFFIPLGIALSSLWWSIMVVKWKLWAYARVRNIHELKRRAIEGKLIHEDGAYLERTEIWSAKDKIRFEPLRQKFLVLDEAPSLQKPHHIYFSKKYTIFLILWWFVMIFFGVMSIIISELDYQEYLLWIGIFFLILVTVMYQKTTWDAPSIKSAFRMIQEKRPQISFYKEGMRIHYDHVGFLKWPNINNHRFLYLDEKQVLQVFYVDEENRNTEYVNIPLLHYRIDKYLVGRIIAYHTSRRDNP